jgi:transporter family-2 protein
VLGVLVIVTAAAVVRATGVLLLGLATISGQVVGALALDLVVPTVGPPMPTTYLGAGQALVAVAITVLGSRTPRRH